MTSRGELVTAAFEQREAIVRGTSSLAGVTGAVPRFRVDGEAASGVEASGLVRRCTTRGWGSMGWCDRGGAVGRRAARGSGRSEGEGERLETDIPLTAARGWRR